MTDHDDLEEPCALDDEGAPGYFHPRPEPPARLTWWQGWWSSHGINSLHDLGLWVEMRLDEMISLQAWDSLADLGRLLGVQTPPCQNSPSVANVVERYGDTALMPSAVLPTSGVPNPVMQSMKVLDYVYL
jgi:hypothetical protein